MPLRIEESFEVEAPPALVWTCVGEPRELARCLSGAEVAEHGDGATRALDARIVLRVGPVRLAYAGTMRVEEKDDAAHRLRLRAEGTGEDGSAGLDATIALAAAAERRTVVHVAAVLDIAGRVMQFGPGMIEGVARRLLGEFAACVRATVEPRTSGAGDFATSESLTLSGAYREHPMLRDTLVGIRSPVASLTPAAAPRHATAVAQRRETAATSLLPRLWRRAIDRLRALRRR